MNILRKFALFVVSSSLVGLLLLSAVFWTLNNSFASRDVVKDWLVQSGAYDNFIQEVVRDTEQQVENDPEVSSIDKALLTKVASKAFTAEYLQTTFESAIDSSYDWLEGDTEDLELSIDLSSAKTTFAEALGREVTAKADSLPQCTLQNLPASTSIDIFSAVCIPPGLDIEAQSSEFTNSVLASEDFIPDPTINAEDIKIDQDGTEKPLTEVLDQAPTWYRVITNGVWVSVALSLLAITSIVFLSVSKRKGLLHIAKAFMVAGALLALMAYFSQKIPLNFGDKGEATSGFSERIIVPFFEQALDTISSLYYTFALVYIAITLVILIALFLTKKRHKIDTADTKPTKESEQQNENSQKPASSDKIQKNKPEPITDIKSLK